jgi:hypothetical protein
MMGNILTYRPGKALRILILLVGFWLAFSFPLRAQSLQLVDMAMPDTFYMGEQYEVLFSIHNDADTNVLGNLQLWFENYSNDSIATPLGGFNNTLQYFAPGQIRQFLIPIEVTPDFFIEGGNTVVIWPSMVGDPRPEDLEEIIIYVVDPNGTTNLPQTKAAKPYLVNPATEQLQIVVQQPKLIWVDLIDFSGRSVLSGLFDAQGSLSLAKVPPGLYVAFLRDPSGLELSRQRILVR